MPDVVLLDGDEHRYAAAVDVLAADEVAGALGGDHEHVDAGGRGDVAEADVEAVAEDQGVAGGDVGLDLLGVQLPLDVVGGEDHDDVGLLHRLGGGEHAQALGLGLGPALRALGQADADVDARVAQGQRVGVALAAVAEDRDVLALDQGEVGVVVVEHLSHGGLLLRRASSRVVGRIEPAGGVAAGHRDGAQRALADRAGAAADGDHAGLHELADAEGLHDLEEVGELVGVAGDLDGHRVGRDVDDAGLEQLDDVEHLAAGVDVGPHLDQQQLAVDRGGAVELDDLDHLDQLVQLLGDLLERRVLDVDHDRHPGDLGVLGRADRQGVDVEAAAAEQAGDAGQDAGLVLDEHARACACSSTATARPRPSNSGARSRAYLMSSLLVPAATIGHTIASRCTRKSTTTGTSSISIALAMVASTSAGLSHEQPDAAVGLGELDEVGDRAWSAGRCWSSARCRTASATAGPCRATRC